MTSKTIIPYIIGTEAKKLDINAGGLYDSVLRSRAELNKQSESSETEVLPLQANIATIQQIYLDLAKKQSVIIEGVEINFLDDYWDFSAVRAEGKSAGNYLFDFSILDYVDCQFSDYTKTVLKLFVLYMITEYGIHCGTNNGRFGVVKRFMKYLQEKHISTIDNITLADLKDYMDNMSCNYATKIKKRRHIRTLLVFYSFISNTNVYTNEMEEWFLDIDTDKVNAIIEKGKTPCPPSDFYRKYCALMWDTAMNDELPKKDRGYAGLLYIGTQTGLRGSETATLHTDYLRVLKYHDKQVAVLTYLSVKNGDPKGSVHKKAETNASEKVIEMFQMLVKLFDSERTALETDLLVPKEKSKYNYNKHSIDRKDVNETDLTRFSHTMCIANAKDLELIESPDAELFAGEVECHLSYKKGKKLNRYPVWAMKASGAEEGQTISLITTVQFRVYVASELHERGVDDRTISYLLNHASEEMWSYYVRPKHPVQDDIDFARETFSEIVKDNLPILGTKGQAMKAKIDAFIAENDFNVEKDLDAIIDKACMEMPIKQKEGGFCMKSNPDRECWHDAETDEFLCAYGCCPNHCHLYFMAPISYSKCQDLAKLVDYNLLDKEWINMAEKEAYKLQTALNHELLPELADMKRMIEENGSQWVINRHPETEYIVTHMEEVSKEITVWQNRINELI